MGLMDIDFYKAGHVFQYPEGTTEVYSNFTPRNLKYLNVLSEFSDGKVVFFGLQDYLENDLIKDWNDNFFSKEKSEVLQHYKSVMDECLNCDFDVSHIASLHDLGYLPLRIKALPEGAKVNAGVPVFTIVNTEPELFWLTNYIETAVSAWVWKLMVNATVAHNYKNIFLRYADATGVSADFVDFQGHDFSMRGMSGVKDAEISGMAHLTSFKGTDVVPAILRCKRTYGDGTFVGGSVPATEHSVMCMGGNVSEHDTIKKLITETYPSGIVSIVSDTWDFWNVIKNIASKLKPDILKRDGKVVFRPDSGDPEKIICGDPTAVPGSNEFKGAVEILSEVFGTTVNDKGFKTLNEKIGLIYGDSITPQRADNILRSLQSKGFASDNIVFGIGSYTYNYSTRDSIGAAMKATSGVVHGERRSIFKDPVTDSGTKKSAKGLLRVEFENGEYTLHEDQPTDDGGELETVFLNGALFKTNTISKIRSRLTS